VRRLHKELSRKFNQDNAFRRFELAYRNSWFLQKIQKSNPSIRIYTRVKGQKQVFKKNTRGLILRKQEND
jgi:hypothetical protein